MQNNYLNWIPVVNICVAVKVFPFEKQNILLGDALFSQCFAVVHPIDCKIIGKTSKVCHILSKKNHALTSIFCFECLLQFLNLGVKLFILVSPQGSFFHGQSFVFSLHGALVWKCSIVYL